MSSPRATIGILSIGSMGLGIAKLLQAHDYRIITNASDRSSATKKRIESASIEQVATDIELVARCDYIFSIIPPRDAASTAQRIVDALHTEPYPRSIDKTPLYYLDLNAIAPATVRQIESTFAAAQGESTPPLRFIDGGIIGGPPTLVTSTESSSTTSNASPPPTWKKPGVPLSGPHELSSAPISGAHLSTVLNSKHISPTIGSASGLKCCFASLSKGFVAIALQSFTTAAKLDVLPYLQEYLDDYNPGTRQKAEKGIVACGPKAYRWVEEMRQIGKCFGEVGDWEEHGRVFDAVSGVFDVVAGVVEGNGGLEEMGDVGGFLDVFGKGQGGLVGQSDGGGNVEGLEKEH